VPCPGADEAAQRASFFRTVERSQECEPPATVAFEIETRPHRSGPPGFGPMGGAEPSPFLAAQQAHLVSEARRLTAGETAVVKEARGGGRRC
jgi:hypothetical protein